MVSTLYKNTELIIIFHTLYCYGNNLERCSYGDIPVLWFPVGKSQLGERSTQQSVKMPPLNEDVDHKIIVSVIPFYHFAFYSKIEVHKKNYY